MEKELTQNNQWIWKRPGAYRVLSLMKEGKSISEIVKEVKWKEETVWNFVCSQTFLRKLEVHLKSVFFEFQKNKILSLKEVSNLFWDITMGRKQVEGLTPDQASRHLVKILSLKKNEPKISNPVNIISNISKISKPEESENLAKEFGFDKLKIENEENPKVYPEANE